jgi:bacillopeptidase F (M6 metalloprotease family)
VVGHYIYCQWFLVVMANSDEILRQEVSPDTSVDGWMDVTLDLSAYAGKTIQLELWNQGGGYGNGGAYWGLLELVDQP